MSLSFLASFFHRQLISYPARIPPTPSLSRKTMIITGANTGLGYSSASTLLSLGTHRVILAVRALSKGEAAAVRLRTETRCPPDAVEVWELDMGSYASVLAFAERAKGLERLDACIANAGVRMAEFKLAAGDGGRGHEETITTNVISTFLLAFLLHSILAASSVRFPGDGPAYFSIVSSELYLMAKFTESDAVEGKIFAAFDDEKGTNLSDRYNVSKLLVNLMVRQMAGMAPLKLKGRRGGGSGGDVGAGDVVINCTAPGYVWTFLSLRTCSTPSVALYLNQEKPMHALAPSTSPTTQKVDRSRLSSPTARNPI